MITYPRNSAKPILQAIAQSPAVFIGGARQIGKSTLVKAIGRRLRIPYITLDDPGMLAASSDPTTFLADLPERVIIDEVQRAPEIFLPIKLSVDENRKPGRFILTGSASVLILPKLSESLAGRMLLTNLWPLSRGEILSVNDSFVDWCFSNARLHTGSFPMKVPSWREIAHNITTGGYPELQTKRSERERLNWFRSYIQTIIYR